MTITPSMLALIATMQHYNTLLATLCHHVDIKASIFLSFVAVLLFAYAYGPVGNTVIFVLGLAFAVAFPIRIAATMLADKPVSLGGGDLDAPALFSVGEEESLTMQKDVAIAHSRAIDRNSQTLKQKRKQNKAIIITSLMLFGYLMGMTALFMAMNARPSL